jgi:hypothetical protein
MNIQMQNDNTCISSSTKRSTIINGTEYKWNDKMKGNNSTQINGKVYIDGYELVDGKWTKTLKALWYKIF